MNRLLIKKLILVFIPLTFLLFIILNYMSTDVGFGKHYITLTNATLQYDTPLTPVKWQLIIWTIIYFWQTGINLFLLVSFAIVVAGIRLYEYPYVFSFWFLGGYMINIVLNIIWLFVFTYSIYSVDLLPIATALMFGISISLYLTIWASYRDFRKASEDGFYNDNFLISWHMRILVHNGLSIYAAWSTIIEFSLLSSSLQYFHLVATEVSSLISMSLLIVVALIYISADLIMLDKHTRYVFTPYFVVVWSLSAILSKNYATWNRLSILDCIFLILAIGVLIVKVIVSTIRHRREEQVGYTTMIDVRVL